MAKRDYYEVLGVEKKRFGRRNKEGVQKARY